VGYSYDARKDGAYYFTYPDQSEERWQKEYDRIELLQCDILRDIFRNPFDSTNHPPPSVSLETRAFAQLIYDDRLYDRLPELATAASEDGCNDIELLQHCRSDAIHVRGCWALDALRGVA
ncbi:MAG: hypothetical protein AAFU85_15485, partial [Planctomycetota bacterium]